MHARIAQFLAATALFMPACAPEDEGDEFRMGTGGSGSGSGGGTVFNTNYLGDDALPEVRAPIGTTHAGIVLKRIDLIDGTRINSFEVVDGEIVARDVANNLYTDEALIDSDWSILGPSSPHELPVRLVAREDIDGVPHYLFAHGGNTLMINTCRSQGDDSIFARLLSGFTLDEATGKIKPLSGTTYIACDNGATGKAAAWGYYDLAQALGDFAPLETAIRVIRADYCYDGVSHTNPGVALQIEDRWTVLSQNDGGPLEAVWGKTGLLCHGQGRSGAIPLTCDGKPTTAIPCPPGASLKSFPGAQFITRLPVPDGK